MVKHTACSLLSLDNRVPGVWVFRSLFRSGRLEAVTLSK